MTHRSTLWTVGIVTVLLYFCCDFAKGAKYPEVLCEGGIDQGDIFTYMREYPTTDSESKSVLRHTVSLISEYPQSFWENAQITVFGPNVSVVFFAGSRSHKIVVSLGVNGEITVDSDHAKIQANIYCTRKSILDCLEGFISDTYIPDHTQNLVNAAVQLILFYNNEVLNNASLSIKGPGIAVSLYSGEAINKFSVQMINGNIRTQAEVSTPVIHVNCGSLIKTTDVMTFARKDLNKWQNNADIWTAAVELLGNYGRNVWKDAEITVYGDDIYVVFYSGQRTNQFEVLDIQGEIIVRNIAMGWTVKFDRILQKYGPVVLEYGARVLDFLRRFVRPCIGC